VSEWLLLSRHLTDALTYLLIVIGDIFITSEYFFVGDEDGWCCFHRPLSVWFISDYDSFRLVRIVRCCKLAVQFKTLSTHSQCGSPTMLSFRDTENQLLRSFDSFTAYMPADHEDLSLSSDLTHVSSSFPSSRLSPSITPSHVPSRLNTHLFHKSFPP